jgi:hypothetical protein
MRKLALLVVAAAALGSAASASASTPRTHGDLLHVRANTNQSSNWFGYDQGSLELGGKLFTSITGEWIVPTATQHTAGQAENSSDWIGIGGGCVDAACTVGDNTLIQTGTEQDVDATGAASYSAWWEIIPAPSIAISMTVAPGDHMHASLAELVPGTNVWTITLQDLTRGETFTQTVPYSSTQLTAEWIEETPLLLDPTGPGLASLPNLTSPAFTAATTNGANANLQAAEEIQLIDSSGNVIGTPSAPNATHDGFDACTWATTCG